MSPVHWLAGGTWDALVRYLFAEPPLDDDAMKRPMLANLLA
ncbi:hypothetical protein [Rosistilla oblonga]